MEQIYLGFGLAGVVGLFGLALVWAAQLVTSAVDRLFRPGLMSTLLLIALPELGLAVILTLAGMGELVVAMVIGASVASLTLVLGISSVLAGSLRSTDRLIEKDMAEVFLLSCLPFVLLMDKTLSGVEGVILVLAYGVYAGRRVYGSAQVERAMIQVTRKQLFPMGQFGGLISGLVLMGGIGLLLGAAMVITLTVPLFVQVSGASIFLVGVLMLGLVTSLPELWLELGAVRKKLSVMTFGTIGNSVVANATLVLGVAAILSPIQLTVNMGAYWLAVIGFILLFGLFWLLVRTNHRLESWEGLLLVLGYCLFGAGQLMI